MASKKALTITTGAFFALGLGSNFAYEALNSHLLQKHTAESLERRLEQLPSFKKLADPNSGYKLLRPWDNMTREQMAAVFNTGALHSPGALPIGPVMFANDSNNSTQTFFYCGYRLAGFPFLVHGGILGTALDEAIHRTAAMSLGKYPQSHLSITLSYKKPTLVHQFLVIKAETSTNKDGQLQIDAYIENLEGKKLVLGRGVFR